MQVMSHWRQFLVVLGKELVESARDRRTLLTALLLGPVGGPLLFTVMMSLGIERGRTDTHEPARVAIVGEQYAPELAAYLASAGAELVTVRPHGAADGGAAAAAEDALRAKRARVALVISADFGARLRAGKPAPLGIYADSSDHHAEGVRSRVLHWLNAYGSSLASTRLQARGVSPELVTPFGVDEIDVATPASRALLMLGMLSYFILLATLIGGLHIAIDMTAGERERGSLEPLLTLPVERSTLVLAKLAAACAYMTLALAITLAAFGLALPHVGLEALGMRANFGPGVAARIFIVVLPFVPVGAGLLTLVASFTRSYREAQTWLSFVLLVPTLPIVFASLYQIEPQARYVIVPSLGQHLLITSLLRDDGLAWPLWLLSMLSCTALAMALAASSLNLWRRESLLG
jgi:sodium transport system permease protein